MVQNVKPKTLCFTEFLVILTGHQGQRSCERLYDEFLARRSRPDEWQEEVLRIRHWVSERKSMH
jgi:hypothetical protein